MSADNWTICPRCKEYIQRDHAQKVAAVMATYGKVPVEEFEAARADIAEVSFQETFREDYEFYGAELGTVTACYSGNCTDCGLSVSFKHEETFHDPAVSSEPGGEGR